MHHFYKNNFRVALSTLSLIVFVFLLSIYLLNFGVENKSNADDQSVSLTASTATAMTFSTSAGGSVALGAITPGNPVSAPATGTIMSVTTNAANGYTIGVADSIAASNSCLVSSGNYIPDYAGTIATPTTWSGTGLGITLYAADTTKEAKWGTGITYNDANNKYAGVPQNSTIAHTVTGYHVSADTSSWAFKIDIPPAQAVGNYTGNVTFTATAVLS